MRKLSTLFCILMPLMLTAQQAMMQLDNIPGDKEVSVTNWVPVVNSVVGDILAIQPYTNRVHAIEARTNAWNTAYGWGDHAGLYRAIGWVPSWGDLTDIPQDFPPSTHEHDYTAVTNPPWLTEYTETDEIALAALAAYAAYWPHNATASSWFTYTTNANEITITGYDVAGGADVRIPSYINGWPVKVIGDEAFQDSGIESVHGNVVTIGDRAFYSCGALTTASFLQATTIGDSAFSSCTRLTTATYPQATTIGGNAFSFCTALATAPFPQATTIGNSAFYSCTSLTTATYPQATTIGAYAFLSCDALTTATYPQATTIGERAFYSCATLATASFPQATTIGYEAFYSCTSLVDITLGTDATNFNVSTFNNINANPTITISNPHAKGWGKTFAGLAVVRPEITADAFTLAGETITEWPTNPTGITTNALGFEIEDGVIKDKKVNWIGPFKPSSSQSSCADKGLAIAAGYTHGAVFSPGTYDGTETLFSEHKVPFSITAPVAAYIIVGPHHLSTFRGTVKFNVGCRPTYISSTPNYILVEYTGTGQSWDSVSETQVVGPFMINPRSNTAGFSSDQASFRIYVTGEDFDNSGVTADGVIWLRPVFFINGDAVVPSTTPTMLDPNDTIPPMWQQGLHKSWLDITDTTATPYIPLDTLSPVRAALANGPVEVMFGDSGSPFPVYVTITGPTSLTVPNATFIGGPMYIPGAKNHYLVWTVDGDTFVQPVTSTTKGVQP